MMNVIRRRLACCLALLLLQSGCLSIKAPERIDLGGGNERRQRDDDNDRHDRDDDDDDDRYDDDDDD